MSQFDSKIDVQALGKVAVLMGGSSAEREVSLMSGAGVLQALRSRGVDAHAFDPAQQDLGELRRQGFARCFIALHGRHGEDGTVQGALELLGIPYTGPGVMASSIAMDKIMTKRIWRFEGLPTPDWRLVSSADDTVAALAALGAPMIVKPAREGSTIGLTKVTDAAQCAQAYELASRYDPEVLCEQFIEGDETTCPILGEGASAHALPVIRIVAPQGNYDYEHKYFTDDTQYHCPSGLPEAEERAIQALVVQAFRTLGCRGWARADIMIRASDRQPFLLEINTSPGMTGHSLVPMSARALGISYEDLCLRLLASATLDTPPGACTGAAPGCAA
ncbi:MULTISPECIES: D-alanine--D-alanine ligase [Simplicispira]|jgi:D-alanine-D-alanine ligase|uniref:D-alanine--D-alanine ligase n=1 Tax=Simplicispira metamorpha TaxID=80881 RepID=A0A4V2SJY8_9BURK|nr:MULTISPECIES: D-alanine--D-alanine ligase [Simplicispira]MBP7412838.1 D-alanine--D-alanine ligase [Giesbergeria sp.]MDD2691211.1 D-alanine--D-alanine ligase [Simplicispira sp.]TCP17486.1 D-alanine-D-alanine ligase [Simplicispira metamorpha]